MKAIEKNIYQLCQKIDYLEAEVQYWKSKYEEEKQSYDKMLNDNLQTAKQGVANALMFGLSVKDDEDGNLVISKEDRKTLSEKIF